MTAQELRQRIQEHRAALWSPDAYPSAEGFDRVWLLARRSVYVVLHTLVRADVQQTASALTMVTLISLVPALAVGFSVLTAFTSLEVVAAQMRKFVLETMAVSPDNVIGRHLDDFISNTNTGALGTVGTLLLFLSALSLLYSIEGAFNGVWGVRKGRSLLARFQTYWPLVTLGPLLAAVSVSATLTLAEQAPFLRALSSATPFFAATVFFALLYKIMPNAKVRTTAALLGGLIAGVLWTLSNKLFPMYAKSAITYSAIYGSLAAIPLFIINVQLSWLVALFGCNLVFAIQTARSGEEPGTDPSDMSVRDRELLSVVLAHRIHETYAGGAGPTTTTDLIERVGWPPSAVQVVLQDLVEAEILLEIGSEADEDPAFVPKRPAAADSMAEVVDAIRGKAAIVQGSRALEGSDREAVERHRTAEDAFLERLRAT